MAVMCCLGAINLHIIVVSLDTLAMNFRVCTAGPALAGGRLYGTERA